MTVKEWSLELDAAFAREMESVRAAVIYIATEALDRVKRRTPVDTGNAKNNWLVSIGAADGSIKELPGNFTAENIAALAAYPDGAYPVIYLQNNLPYAVKLEYGHSKQAPAGMVAITIPELEALLQGVEI